MVNLIIGIILLVIGGVATATSPNTVYYGAIVVGIINIIRGLIKISSRPRGGGGDDDHRTAY